MKKTRYDYIVWDFNGTLLDDLDVCIECANTLLARRSRPAITRELYKQSFDFPIRDYYHKIGLKCEDESYDDVAAEWVREYMAEIPKAPLNPYVRETIDYFSSLGAKQVILSMTEQKMLNEQVRGLGIYELFDEVLGSDNIYGVSKTEFARMWRKTLPADSRLLLIGDTTHDAATAEAMGADCVLVARGHQPKEKLLGCGVPVFDDLADLRAGFDFE